MSSSSNGKDLDSIKIKVNFNTMVEDIDRGSGRMRLVRTDRIDDVKEIDLEFLKELYNSKDKTKVVYASVLKAAILQRRICFLLSRNELNKLVKADSDNHYKSVNEKDYSNFIMHLMGNGILNYMYDENDYAGVASLVNFHRNIVKSFKELESDEFYAKQINDARKIYEKKLERVKKQIEKKAKNKPENADRKKFIFKT